MPASQGPVVLLLAAALALSPAIGEAKRHGHGHHGWMHARVAAFRGWFRRTVHAAPPRRSAAPAESSLDRARRRAEAQAALAARRRSAVDAYLRDHPVYASAD